MAKQRRPRGPASADLIEELSCIASGKSRTHGTLEQMPRKKYEAAMTELQADLVELQESVRKKGLRVVVLFEGRDTAGKGGIIKRITQSVSPRVFRIVALGTPSDTERTQWYFQRYVAHLPAAGEIVLFDRSWYNRGGVEPVMGFCTKKEHEEFLRSCPEFENMLVHSGIILIKYFLVVSADEQERRFRARTKEPAKRWKLSPMDLASMDRWIDYARAYKRVMDATNTETCPWYIVDAEVKRRARLNCISHLLSLIPHSRRPMERIKIPKRRIRGSFTFDKLKNPPILIPARY
jgi:polyphosphate kinase 2